ncbi:uncharacterized protein LY89DRAFT_191303 [Mollisia scopiformis]|uniref:Uncharacterized protein n=1 Tax=Mollisia scopiformis TaxID=149040 RepID=A0A194WYG1_MOLSC|nr:uncharacterized protein LY89DRAFT_191303 [Mollisia scopiformis]KUJ12724.1 hypothetical protein LY89DRAFT_191303 [Mollisia scopiformis]
MYKGWKRTLTTDLARRIRSHAKAVITPPSELRDHRQLPHNNQVHWPIYEPTCESSRCWVPKRRNEMRNGDPDPTTTARKMSNKVTEEMKQGTLEKQSWLYKSRNLPFLRCWLWLVDASHSRIKHEITSQRSE